MFRINFIDYISPDGHEVLKMDKNPFLVAFQELCKSEQVKFSGFWIAHVAKLNTHNTLAKHT